MIPLADIIDETREAIHFAGLDTPDQIAHADQQAAELRDHLAQRHGIDLSDRDQAETVLRTLAFLREMSDDVRSSRPPEWFLSALNGMPLDVLGIVTSVSVAAGAFTRAAASALHQRGAHDG